MTSMNRIPEPAQHSKEGFVRYPMEWITPERIQRLGASGVTLLLVLISHANQDGVAWPSKERLAQYLGMSVRRIRQLISLLEEEGYIERTYSRGHTVYRILAGGNQPKGEERKPISAELDLKELDLKELKTPPPSYSPPSSPTDSRPDGMAEGGEELKEEPKTQEAPQLSGERSPGGSQISPARPAGMPPGNGVKTVGEAMRELVLSPEDARAEAAMRQRWQVPEPPREMVRALVDAGVWQRLAQLRRYARDGRAWQEWLAGPLATTWRSAPEAFPGAIGEALDALASRPEVRDPLSYLLAVARKRLNGLASPSEEDPAARALRLLREGQIPSDEDMAELFRRRGVPTKAGLGAFGGLSVNGEWVYARLNGEIIAVSRHEAARRFVNAAPGEVAHAG